MKCELCDSVAKMYCESDQASLCWDCDAQVHGANFLVAKHSRTLLCHVCQSLTPWNGTGRKLGPTVSVCENCVNRLKQNEAINQARNQRNGEEDDDEDEDEDHVEDHLEDDDDEDDDNSDGDDDDDGDDDGDGDGDGDGDEGDEENQVVPWSSTPPPPVSSSSTSEECPNRLCSGEESHSKWKAAFTEFCAQQNDHDHRLPSQLKHKGRKRTDRECRS
ncbi:zinc finger protein CONSTANS-LIKE 4 isoform X1 [Ziziphus jujuba]|uniref:Zinc finger protein CONSTANS-LIKE 4 isoform X1 n=1 Tax=Ziziphus jujuba TaxID=326968 RepID=A0A6P4AHB2_ZIZJJ|nr:zinc finger protein CONSTANS-LIKE 4 isoform X1 [Ziziphus jujuba]